MYDRLGVSKGAEKLHTILRSNSIPSMDSLPKPRSRMNDPEPETETEIAVYGIMDS